MNLAPADIKKEGPLFDWPIAIGSLVASGRLTGQSLSETSSVGELSLDGTVRAVEPDLRWAQRLYEYLSPFPRVSPASMGFMRESPWCLRQPSF